MTKGNGWTDEHRQRQAAIPRWKSRQQTNKPTNTHE